MGGEHVSRLQWHRVLQHAQLYIRFWCQAVCLSPGLLPFMLPYFGCPIQIIGCPIQLIGCPVQQIGWLSTSRKCFFSVPFNFGDSFVLPLNILFFSVKRDLNNSKHLRRNALENFFSIVKLCISWWSNKLRGRTDEILNNIVLNTSKEYSNVSLPLCLKKSSNPIWFNLWLIN